MKLKTRKEKLKDLICRVNKYKYGFQKNQTIRPFGESIYTRKITIDEAIWDQSNLLKNIIEFNEKSRPRTKEGKDEKEILMKLYMIFIKIEN